MRFPQMGTVLHKEIHGSTMGWIGNLLKGDTMIMGFPPGEFTPSKADLVAGLTHHLQSFTSTS